MARQLSLFGSTPPAPRRAEAPPAASPGLASRHAWIEAVLRPHLGPKLVVRLTDNRSTMISVRTRRGVRYVRLHRSFGTAPVPVLEAVASFLGGGRLTSRRAQVLDRFIDGIPSCPRARRAVELRPRGQHHDLQRILDRLNERYFGGSIQARITWSRASRRKRRRSAMCLGTYSADLGLIRIHPALDQPFVPDFFVESVVHHEMLHERHGTGVSPTGRRILHSPAFRAEERQHPDYTRARTWERKHIHLLLRY